MSKKGVTYEEGEDTEVELFSPKARGQFAALGISKDSKMGEDLVMSCAEVRGMQERVL